MPDHGWVDDAGLPDSGGFDVAPVQAYQANKTYRCPGCDHEIRIGEHHTVVVPHSDPNSRRHWHSACWQGEQRRGKGAR